MSGMGNRRAWHVWTATCFTVVALGACIIVNPPPAPTPTPMPTPTPTRQTAIDVVAVVEGGSPAIIGQTVRVAMTLADDSYSERGRWQWERSSDGLTGWKSVPGARLTDSSLYAPVSADKGKYLRASVPFVDSDDVAKTGLSPTVGPVVGADIKTDVVRLDEGDDPVAAGRPVRVRLNLSSADYSELGRWRWDRSDNGLRDWTDVTDYEADDPAGHTPSASDKGKFFRVSAIYLDKDGNYVRGLSQTIGPVVTVPTVADAAAFSLGHNPPKVGTEIQVAMTLASDKYSNRDYWKWERSKDGLSGWEDITDYSTTSWSRARYTPVSADVGKFLRASVLYVDSAGEDKRALTQTIGPVGK